MTNYFDKYIKYKSKYFTLKHQIGGQQNLMDFLYEIEQYMMDIFIYFCKSSIDIIPYSKNNGEFQFVDEPVRNLGNVADVLGLLQVYPQMKNDNIKKIAFKTIENYKFLNLNTGAKSFLLISMIFYQISFNEKIYNSNIEIIVNDLFSRIQNNGSIICEDQIFFAGEILHALNIYNEYVKPLDLPVDKISDYYQKYYENNVLDNNRLFPFFVNWQLQGLTVNNKYTNILINQTTDFLDNNQINILVEYACALEGLVIHLDIDTIYSKYRKYISNLIELFKQAKSDDYNGYRLDELAHCMNVFLNILMKNRLELWKLREIPVIFLKTGDVIRIENKETDRYTREGVFITIYENDKLAGCIGSFYDKNKNIPLENKIIDRTIATANDRRFGHNLEYFRNRNNISTTITIIGPVKIYDINDVNDYYVARYHGVILYCDNQQYSTYLPNVIAEQKWLDGYNLNIVKIIKSLEHKSGISSCNGVKIGLYSGYEI